MHLSDTDDHARFYDTGATAMDELLSPNRRVPASEELIESFKLLLAEIEARTNSAHQNEDDTALPNIPPSMPGEFPTLRKLGGRHSTARQLSFHV